MDRKELIGHADFIKSLALHLVADEHQAADIRQQTWLAALENPTNIRKSLQAWLARVSRNIKYMAYRDEKHRKEREQASIRRKSIPTPVEIVEKLEIRQLLVDELLHLKEPYRSTIVLRFYEDLKVKEIAGHQGVPLDTVKTRLQRGLAQLRERLDARHSGSRTQWLTALAPLCGAKFAASVSGSTTALAGVLVMTTKVKITAAVVLLLGLAFTLWQLLPNQAENDTRLSSHPGKELIAHQDKKEPAPRDRAIESKDNITREIVPTREILKPKGLVISGLVTDMLTEKPIKAFHIQLDQDMDPRKKRIVEETVTHEEGRFSIPIDESGFYSLNVFSSRYFPGRGQMIHVSPEKKTKEVHLELFSGESVSGRVVEDATGQPVQNAVVGAEGGFFHYTDLTRILIQGRMERCIHARTDENGYFILQGLANWVSRFRVAAVHPDWAEGVAWVDPEFYKPVEIRLKEGFHVFGKAYDDLGLPAEGLLITLSGWTTPLSRPVLTGPDGNFRCPPALPGEVCVTAESLDRNGGESTPFTPETKRVVIEDRDVEVIFGPDPGHVTWYGKVIDYTDLPLEKVRIRLYPVEASDAKKKDVDMRFFASDEKGSFEVKKLVAGKYALELEFPEQKDATDWEEVAFDHPGRVEKDIILPGSGGVLCGKVLDEATEEPYRPQKKVQFVIRATKLPWRSYRDNFEAFLNDEDGGFCFRNLPAGNYTVRFVERRGSSSNPLEVELREGQIVEGLVMRIPAMGVLKVEYVDFSPAGLTHRLECQDGTNVYSIDPRGVPLRTGNWVLGITGRKLGMYTRAFRIEQGKTTKIKIHENELPSFEGNLWVSGLLKHTDGSPVKGARLRFVPTTEMKNPMLGTQSEDNFTRSVECTTDEKGGFLVNGFKSGCWDVDCFPEGGVNIRLPLLTIPLNPSDPYKIELVIPGGKVKGILCDKRTGLPLGEEDPEWTARLRNSKTGNYLITRCRRKGTGKFLLCGVPEGEYQLIVRVPGCGELESEPFSLAESQTHDLGKIFLEPMGKLNLEIRKPEGEPVTTASFTCLGKEPDFVISGPNQERYYLYHLPLGQVDITIEVKGFKTQILTVCLEAFQTAEASIVLQRE